MVVRCTFVKIRLQSSSPDQILAPPLSEQRPPAWSQELERHQWLCSFDLLCSCIFAPFFLLKLCFWHACAFLIQKWKLLILGLNLFSWRNMKRCATKCAVVHHDKSVAPVVWDRQSPPCSLSDARKQVIHNKSETLRQSVRCNGDKNFIQDQPPTTMEIAKQAPTLPWKF